MISKIKAYIPSEKFKIIVLCPCLLVGTQIYKLDAIEKRQT
jgi:hypothetical protein